MTPKRLFCLVIVLCFASALMAQSGDSPVDAVEAFKKFIANEQSSLADLNSVEMTASLTITEYIPKDWSKPPNIYRHTIHVMGKGDNLKQTEEVFDKNGNLTCTRIRYLTPKKIVYVENYPGQTFAKIFTLGTGPQYGLFNCPAFLEYSSLFSCSDPYGVAASVPSALASKDTWSAMLQRAPALTFTKDGSLRAAFKGNKCSWSVDLIKLPGSNADYRVGAFSLFDDKGILERKVETLDSSHDSVIGEVGKTFRISFYTYFDQSRPSYIWDMEVSEIKINGSMDDDSLVFDPASVQEIFDGDSNVWIKVSK